MCGILFGMFGCRKYSRGKCMEHFQSILNSIKLSPNLFSTCLLKKKLETASLLYASHCIIMCFEMETFVAIFRVQSGMDFFLDSSKRFRRHYWAAEAKNKYPKVSKFIQNKINLYCRLCMVLFQVLLKIQF